ncbi:MULTISPECIES: alpha/beta fold hydrolase [Halorussus]|uniref:alpha/beta fold hydrolase n=1 Tax=Halorussus TaxID=1070314 RepID=UPI0020A1C666|nr:alpha/beta hydrolase [Halorussus vallis]USZ77463.1 alpha/beta hydrolase [Halorussus vallis]
MSQASERSDALTDSADQGVRTLPPRAGESGQVENDGLSIYYETAGDPDGVPVVFVEGWGTGRWMWRRQRRALPDRFRTIFPDNRGTGRSDTPAGPRNLPELFAERTGRWWANCLSLWWPPAVAPWMQWAVPVDKPYTISDMAGDLEAVLAAQDVREAHVVGASMGGMIALRYAIEYDRAKTLSLLGSTPGGSAAADPPARVRRLAVSGAGRRLSRAAVRERTRVAMSDEFVASRPALVERIVDWREECDATPAGRFLQAVAASGFDVGRRLDEVRIPVHVLHGTADTVVPVENGRILADRLPNARYTPVDGGSHFVFFEEFETVNESLVEFFDEHADG